ncbi:transcriptional activator NhaR [Salinivibrio proteolyticus]|uniref:transcriptional activator NhaR n=1 Tax=Salinivibrio proteolyticus TaxID=334715 RepID=UPI0009893C1A|nr:transcriptional activator NhaR [Salinivibrio proteolyticus]OOF25819.1 transcriptional activator NhaR [Salinivibrio proteolyticus]
MAHLNYNHLYYFWMVCKQGSITKGADKLCLTPQTVTGQIRALEQRLNGKLTKRNGRHVEPTELGQLVFQYADRMFGLSYEMLDIVNYSQQENILFDVGVADALSKQLVSQVLLHVVPDDNAIHLRCFESTHEMLLEQLSQHKLDMILSDCPVDSTQQAGLFSVKLGECSMSLFASHPDILGDIPIATLLASQKLLIPSRATAMGRKLMQWFDQQGIVPNILGEFDDSALMKAFGINHQALFIAPSTYANEISGIGNVAPIANLETLKEEYYVIFAERMIQHPAVKRICEADYSHLFV